VKPDWLTACENLTAAGIEFFIVSEEGMPKPKSRSKRPRNVRWDAYDDSRWQRRGKAKPLDP
jgi:hypothetical protein